MEGINQQNMDTESLRGRLLEGLVIPACPLPLNENRSWSEQHQRALARYYIASQAGGIAVGVHTTQFNIRDPKIGLLEPVLELMSEEIDAVDQNPLVKVAGICGQENQAVKEAETASRLGYHAGLLSLAALKGQAESAVIDHCRAISQIIPVIGFYLQPAVGGQVLSHRFWRQFAEIPNVVAIKIAPFDRYKTWDVVRAIIETGRNDIAMYTGNDDNIIIDLLTCFEGSVNGQRQQRFFNGGLLGQWAVWTSGAVKMLNQIKADRTQPQMPARWLTENIALTDANASIFDSANDFKGCIAGIMEVLRRVGLSPSAKCLDPRENLSPGQAEELDRVMAAYPHLTDDEFVAGNLAVWLK